MTIVAGLVVPLLGALWRETGLQFCLVSSRNSISPGPPTILMKTWEECEHSVKHFVSSQICWAYIFFLLVMFIMIFVCSLHLQVKCQMSIAQAVYFALLCTLISHKHGRHEEGYEGCGRPSCTKGDEEGNEGQGHEGHEEVKTR